MARRRRRDGQSEAGSHRRDVKDVREPVVVEVCRPGVVCRAAWAPRPGVRARGVLNAVAEALEVGIRDVDVYVAALYLVPGRACESARSTRIQQEPVRAAARTFIRPHKKVRVGRGE